MFSFQIYLIALFNFHNFPKITCGIPRQTNQYTTALYEFINNTYTLRCFAKGWFCSAFPCRVSIYHIDLWRKKCHRWHSTDECFNNSTTVSSYMRCRWLPTRHKCQESPKSVTPSENNQRGVDRMSVLINGITIAFVVHIIVHLKRHWASQESAIILRDSHYAL